MESMVEALEGALEHMKNNAPALMAGSEWWRWYECRKTLRELKETLEFEIRSAERCAEWDALHGEDDHD
jgi:hypothetical protein